MNIRQVLRPDLQRQVIASERRPQKRSAPSIGGRTDRASWSRQALALIEEQNRLAWEKPEGEQEENSRFRKLEKDLKKQEKLMKIFARIRNGDIVPQEDLNYLANNDPASFVLAMAQRQPKRNPQRCESVLDDEDRKEAAAGTSAVGEMGGESAGSAPAAVGAPAGSEE